MSLPRFYVNWAFAGAEEPFGWCWRLNLPTTPICSWVQRSARTYPRAANSPTADTRRQAGHFGTSGVSESTWNGVIGRCVCPALRWGQYEGEGATCRTSVAAVCGITEALKRTGHGALRAMAGHDASEEAGSIPTGPSGTGRWARGQSSRGSRGRTCTPFCSCPAGRCTRRRPSSSTA